MKTKEEEPALQAWIHKLPFTQQALLMLSLRGPDGLPKFNGAKPILHYMRGVVLRAAYPFDGQSDGFMRGDYELFVQHANSFFVDVDAYPHHFLMHLFHAAGVVGYKHPEDNIRICWNDFYNFACKSLHMTPETEEELDERLSK